MSSEAYRRVGRGGAGNFYSQRDVEDAKKIVKSTDSKSQTLTSSEAAGAHHQTSTSTPGSTGLTRAGRGGAGNFYEPETIAESVAREEEARRARAALQEQQHTTASSLSSSSSSRGLSGRGGAGNWMGQDQAAAAIADEQRRKKLLEAKVLLDVEAGLAMPPRTYHHQGRGG